MCKYELPKRWIKSKTVNTTSSAQHKLQNHLFVNKDNIWIVSLEQTNKTSGTIILELQWNKFQIKDTCSNQKEKPDEKIPLPQAPKKNEIEKEKEIFHTMQELPYMQ